MINFSLEIKETKGGSLLLIQVITEDKFHKILNAGSIQSDLITKIREFVKESLYLECKIQRFPINLLRKYFSTSGEKYKHVLRN